MIVVYCGERGEKQKRMRGWESEMRETKNIFDNFRSNR